jgi:hypothetical protein
MSTILHMNGVPESNLLYFCRFQVPNLHVCVKVISRDKELGRSTHNFTKGTQMIDTNVTKLLKTNIKLFKKMNRKSKSSD